MSLLIILILGIPIALLRGLVLSDLVGWFTSFHLGVVQAVGICFIVAMFTSHLKTGVERTEGQPWLEYSVAFMLSQVMFILTAWLFGYLWSLFL